MKHNTMTYDMISYHTTQHDIASYDRVFYKAVPDFIDLHYGSFHWFTFNVADIFITLGIVAFFIRGFFFREN